MQQIWTLQYFFCEQYHHTWQILLILCKSHVVSLKTHQFQFPNYSVFYPRYLIFPIHWFKIHKTLSFYYPENLTPALFFVNRFLSSATKPKTLLSSFFIFPSLHLTPHFPFLYLYWSCSSVWSKHSAQDFFPPSVRSKKTRETKAPQ